LVELLGASDGESALKKSIINALLLERSVYPRKNPAVQYERTYRPK